jgi:hypothetical protein
MAGRGGTLGKSSPEYAEMVAREARAVELRAAGLTLEHIADRLGFAGPSGAFKAIARGIRRVPAQEVESLRQVQGLALDLLQSSIMAKALDPNARGQLLAVDRVLAIVAERSKLFGLYAPAKQEVTGADAGPVRFTIEVPPGRSVETARRLLAEEEKANAMAALMAAEQQEQAA